MDSLLKASLSLGYYTEQGGRFSRCSVCSPGPRTVLGTQQFNVCVLKENVENTWNSLM